MRSPIRRPNGHVVRIAALCLVALLEVALVVYIVSYPPTFTGPVYVSPTTTTTTKITTTSSKVSTTIVPQNSIVVKAAFVYNGTLTLDVKNTGSVATADLVVMSICSPGFVNCVKYSSAAGRSYTAIFVLPAGREFAANFAGVCVFPIAACSRYHPVYPYSYYLTVRFDFASGSPVTVPVTVAAHSTWAQKTSIANITSSLLVFTKNLTGWVNATITTVSTATADNYTVMVKGWKSPASGLSITLVSNKTGCGGRLTDPCSSPFTGLTHFNAVQTGIYPGEYYGVVIHDLNYTSTYFALWVEVKT